MATSDTRPIEPSTAGPGPQLPQQPLGWSVLLHLLPGAALTAFVVLAAPVMRAWELPPVFALFLGIGLVIVPIELGYLALYARRTTGSWSPLGAVGYRTRLPVRRLAPLAVGLAAWFLVLLLASAALLDPWLADRVFGWMPAVLTDLAVVDPAGDTPPPAVLALMMGVVLAFNGVLGPVTEELYFRGHLLPRIDRLGGWAPVLNTVLFSLYHFWTPWQNVARVLGFLPISWVTWRTRSVYVGVAAHVATNLVFTLALFALVLSGGS